jgi:molybdate transport system ATP-binding protein
MLLEVDVNLRRPNFHLAAQWAANEPVTALFGPSGAGKTTTLELIAGTLHPNRGRISLESRALFDSRRGILVPPERRGIAAVSSRIGDEWPGTVQAGLSEACAAVSGRRRLFEPEPLIDLLELGPLLDKRAAQLSAGEGQRVALARALLKSPRLLLLDDPLTSVEAGIKARVLPFLREAAETFELPMLYAGHSLNEILQLTDRFVLMAGGRILRSGAFREIAGHDTLREIAGLSRAENILPVTVLSHDRETGCTLAESYGIRLVLPLCLRLPEGASSEVTLRSGDIALSKNYIAGISIQNQIRGRICALIPNGDGMVVQVDCGSTLLAGITLRAYRDMGLKEGDTVYCLAKAQSFAYLDEPERSAVPQILSHGHRCFVGEAAASMADVAH